MNEQAVVDKMIAFIEAKERELQANKMSADNRAKNVKEMRNNGYLDNLKELRHKVITQRLSLQENFKNLKTLTDYFNLLNNI